jgi:hypothetical protein
VGGKSALPRLLASGALVLCGTGCATPLPPDRGTALDGPDDAGVIGSARLAFDPPASAGGAAPITRLTVDFAGPISSPRVIVVAGSLTSAQLRDLGRSTVPQTLSDRAIKSLAWSDGSDAARAIVVPLEPLAPGGLYSVGCSDPPTGLPFTVEADTPPPILPRLWPDHEEFEPRAIAAIWCGASDLTIGSRDVLFDPAGVTGRFVGGTGAPFSAARCVSWFAGAGGPDAAQSPAVAPASLVLGDGSRVLLEPTLLWSGGLPPSAPPDNVACDPVQIAFGPGCAEVLDDRLVVQPPYDPIFWTIAAGSATITRATREGARFVVRPMPPDGSFRVAVLDRTGRTVVDGAEVTPGPVRPHVVINEVMANPAGAEPAQEWVELYNDGPSATPLEGFSLDDAGGHAALPEATLESGAFALVVSEAYVDDDGVDPVAAPGTLLLRVPALGKAGLSNDGERLVLRDAAGNVISAFPAVKTKNGVSVARVAPDALDEDDSAFEMSGGKGATPGAANF